MERAGPLRFAMTWKRRFRKCSKQKKHFLQQACKHEATAKARRRQCDVRFSIARRNRVFQKTYLRIGLRKLLRMGSVLARGWRVQAVGIAPTERLKLRRQMASAVAGKEESVSLSLFMDVNNLEVEEELSTMATLAWAEGVWLGKWRREQLKAWRKHIFEVQSCETRDLGTQWPHWHTLTFEGQVAVDMRVVFPQDVKKCF